MHRKTRVKVFGRAISSDIFRLRCCGCSKSPIYSLLPPSSSCPTQLGLARSRRMVREVCGFVADGFGFFLL